MKILITGGAGFIGSHLSDALLAAGHEITIIDDLSSGTKDFLPKEAEFLKMDIRDEKLTDIFKERHFDIIYHEAAQTMVPAPIKITSVLVCLLLIFTFLIPYDL